MSTLTLSPFSRQITRQSKTAAPIEGHEQKRKFSLVDYLQNTDGHIIGLASFNK